MKDRVRGGERPKKTYDTKKSTRLLIIISSVLLLGVVGMVIYNVITVKDRNAYMQETENGYEQSFYELLQGVNDMESKLAKLALATSVTEQRKLLNDVNKLSAVSVGHLGHLIRRSDGDNRIARFLNQLGEYTDSLYKKALKNQPLQEEDAEKIEEIRKMIDRLGRELASVEHRMNDGYRLINGFTDNETFLKDIFDGLNHSTVEYPSMIYDGPFSDSEKPKTPAGLTGEEVTVDAAKAIVSALYGGKGLKRIDLLSESGGVIPSYNFLAVFEGSAPDIYISVTKKGGKILTVDAYRPLGDQSLSEEECVSKAEQFVELLGFSSMRKVWVSDYDGLMYVNFVYEKNDIIYYSDMVKVKVASDNGDILGAETANYYLNHKDRELSAPAIDKKTAAESISKKLVINNVRLALIPLDGGEVLCYEFYCDYDESLYFAYVDAATGEEVNILRVIDSGSGKLLY